MTLVRTEEQEILARTAREFVSSRSPLRRVRELREADCPLCALPRLPSPHPAQWTRYSEALIDLPVAPPPHVRADVREGAAMMALPVERPLGLPERPLQRGRVERA